MRLSSPFSWIYGQGMVLRNRAFDHGLFRAESVGLPVISVGNLTAGGTGKTPLVDWIAKLALAGGKRVGVISRGYGRKSRGIIVVSNGKEVLCDATVGGDEPVLIAEHNPGAVVVVCERRVEAAKKAQELGADILVMDDGFQHRHLSRQLDIVVWNAKKDPAAEELLPGGRLREPLTSLRRADVIVISHWSKAEQLVKWREQFSSWFSGSVAAFAHKAEGIFNLDGTPSNRIVAGKRVMAFSGIGNPSGFELSLKDIGVSVLAHEVFSDHHRFVKGDLANLFQKAKTAQAEMLVTTEKDAIRLRAIELDSIPIPIVVLCVHAQFLEGEDLLKGKIQSTWHTNH